MDLLVNDLSIQGQFRDLSSFHDALEQVVRMCLMAERKWKIYCNRNLVNTYPIQNISMQEAVHSLDKNKCRAIMIWLTKNLFWDDPEQRKHSENDLLECVVNMSCQVVTDTAVGEAAFRTLNDSPCGMVSAPFSSWQFSPVQVMYRSENGEAEDRSVEIENFFNLSVLESHLQKAEPPINSWYDLKKVASDRFDRLVFAEDCFKPLTDVPFKLCSAEKLVKLLDVLNQLVPGSDGRGDRTPEQWQLHENYFTGDNAHFSDSSNTEKRKFEKDLTFPHPERPGRYLFCPYHGKERSCQLRFHFNWPVQQGESVYVVYIWPKLTKQ